MISILFVDDEINILEGIRNTLRKRMNTWNVGFAESGAAALEILSQAKYDIIVSDMRMPGMDGATLLERVHDLYPEMTRFILTGQADREAILRAIPVTHQFIYKPCTPLDLIAILEQTCALYDRIQNDAIRSLVSAAKYVPSVPKTAMRISEIAAGGHGTLRDVARVVEEDPGLSARVLQVANSAYIGRTKPVLGIDEAVSLIGVECAQALAISNDVFVDSQENRLLSRLVSVTYAKSFRGAVLTARYLTGHPQKSLGMTSALLRDIGIVVSVAATPPILAAAMHLLEQQNETLQDFERRTIGITHAEIGAHLLALWGTPMTVVEAVTCHHTIHESTLDPYVMAAIHVGDIVAEYGSLPLILLREKLDWNYIAEHDLETEVNEWLSFEQTGGQRAA